MRSETRKESYEGWPIPSIKNIEDEEGFSPFLSGFALGTDPSPVPQDDNLAADDLRG